MGLRGRTALHGGFGQFAVVGFRSNRVSVSPSQERHDASSNGNPRLPHLSSAGQHLYSPAPPLSHTGVAEYQPPPYFPPPYQQLAYSQSADPYSHLGEAYAAAINPLHQPAPTGSQQQAWPGRQSQEGTGLPSHHGRPASLLPHLSGLDGGAMSARRDAYRRSDLLLPHAHALDAAGLAENVGLHDMAHPMEEVQVSGASAAAPSCPRLFAPQPLSYPRPGSPELIGNFVIFSPRMSTTSTCFCTIRLLFAKVGSERAQPVLVLNCCDVFKLAARWGHLVADLGHLWWKGPTGTQGK